jgi:hypothetical protein
MVTSISFFVMWFRFRPNELEQGLDVKKLEMRSSKQRDFAKYSMLVMTTLFLPVARDVVQVRIRSIVLSHSFLVLPISAGSICAH